MKPEDQVENDRNSFWWDEGIPKGCKASHPGYEPGEYALISVTGFVFWQFVTLGASIRLCARRVQSVNRLHPPDGALNEIRSSKFCGPETHGFKSSRSVPWLEESVIHGLFGTPNGG